MNDSKKAIKLFLSAVAEVLGATSTNQPRKKQNERAN
jgi:hypothetical protein